MLEDSSLSSLTCRSSAQRSIREEMSTSTSEFKEMLNSETLIDLDKLRDAARHGIPIEVRGEVWKYLLGVSPANRSQELTCMREKQEEYVAIDKRNDEIIKRVRGEVGRYQNKIKNGRNNRNGYDGDRATVIENVVCAYMNHYRDVEYYPAFVHLCGPFAYCVRKEPEVYYCFERLLGMLDEYYCGTNGIIERVANFMRLFRTVIPELCSYFEEEEVDVSEWATSWLQYLLARELPLDLLMRLWDTYFSMPDPLDFHPYVCLAILRQCRDSLEDLEQSEIRSQLLRLPHMDMAQIINQAFNIRHEMLEQEPL